MKKELNIGRCRRRKTISGAPDRLNVTGIGNVFFYFFPKTVDVHGNGGIIPQSIHAPDAFVQDFPGKNNINVLHKKQKEFIFFVFQTLFFSLDINPVRDWIKQDVPAL